MKPELCTCHENSVECKSEIPDSVNKGVLCDVCRKERFGQNFEPVHSAVKSEQSSVDIPRGAVSSVVQEETNKHTCDRCDFSCELGNSFLFHYRTFHKEDRPFPCSKCRYRARTKYHLTYHMSQVHSGAKPSNFNCSQCQYKSKASSSLASHIHSYHSDERRPFCCSHCQYSCKSQSSLTTHLKRIHSISSETLFSCSQCPYSCKSRSDFERHMKKRDHSDEKPFNCPLCPAIYTHNSNLEKHMQREH